MKGTRPAWRTAVLALIYTGVGLFALAHVVSILTEPDPPAAVQQCVDQAEASGLPTDRVRLSDYSKCSRLPVTEQQAAQRLLDGQ